MTNLKFIFYLRIHEQMRRMVKGLFCAAPQPPLLSLIWYTHNIMKFVFYNRIFLLVSLLSVSNDVLLLTSIYIHHVEQQRWCEQFMHSNEALFYEVFIFHLFLFTFDSKFPRFSNHTHIFFFYRATSKMIFAQQMISVEKINQFWRRFCGSWWGNSTA